MLTQPKIVCKFRQVDIIKWKFYQFAYNKYFFDEFLRTTAKRSIRGILIIKILRLREQTEAVITTRKEIDDNRSRRKFGRLASSKSSIKIYKITEFLRFRKRVHVDVRKNEIYRRKNKTASRDVSEVHNGDRFGAETTSRNWEIIVVSAKLDNDESAQIAKRAKSYFRIKQWLQADSDRCVELSRLNWRQSS